MMASTIVGEISRLHFQDIRTPSSATITDVKQLSSYNWIEAPTPTIAVPGSPSLWSPPQGPRQLKKDSGLVYIAQNAARHPESPLEPLFRSLYITHPTFDIRTIDVVSDRNNIRKLLSFINPSSSKNGLEDFTIRVELTKNTAIFCREETATSEIIGPGQFRGYGHEFEKKYATDRINGSTGHHRIITYRFGDLNFVVRHKTDGYVDDVPNAPSSSTTQAAEDRILSSALESLSLSTPSSPPTTTPAGSKLTIQQEGRTVPLASTLEIKTRVIFKPIDFNEVAPQLWVSQTPKLVRAYHQKGRFQPPAVEDMTTQIKTWEEKNQDDLRKLHALIGTILSLVKGCGGQVIVKYNIKSDRLVLEKENTDGSCMLPKDLYSKWDDEDADAERTKAEESGKTIVKSNSREQSEDGEDVALGPGDMNNKDVKEEQRAKVVE